MEFNPYRFKIRYNPQEDPVMYTRIFDNRYAKTYMEGNRLLSAIIDIQEYASALAHVMLKNDDYNIPI